MIGGCITSTFRRANTHSIRKNVLGDGNLCAFERLDLGFRV
jgi:hypothetical protein